MLHDDFLWVEKYRPHRVADTILPKQLKLEFQEYVNSRRIPNLLLCGTSGTGKTTVAKAMMDELQADYMFMNGSLTVNMDAVRTDITDFASTVSPNGRKYVIIDEADYLSPSRVQPALRNFIESFSDNTGFIFTANHKNRIIPELHSRFAIKEFVISKEESGKLALQQLSLLGTILTKEKIEHDAKVLALLIQRYFPDFRKVIGECQAYAVHGKIDAGILTSVSDAPIAELIKHMKSKDFTNVRKFVTENTTIDANELVRRLYDVLPSLVKPATMPPITEALNDCQYKAAFVANPDINVAACCAVIMAIAEWK